MLSAPEVGRCYASLGRTLCTIGKQEEGISVLKKGITVVPNYGDNYFLAAEIAYKKQQFLETFELCELGLKNCHENYWCTIISNTSYFPYLLMGLSQYYLGNNILGLGYLAIAKEKNNNEEINNIYTNIINQVLNGVI